MGVLLLSRFTSNSLGDWGEPWTANCPAPQLPLKLASTSDSTCALRKAEKGNWTPPKSQLHSFPVLLFRIPTTLLPTGAQVLEAVISTLTKGRLEGDGGVVPPPRKGLHNTWEKTLQQSCLSKIWRDLQNPTAHVWMDSWGAPAPAPATPHPHTWQPSSHCGISIAQHVTAAHHLILMQTSQCHVSAVSRLHRGPHGHSGRAVETQSHLHLLVLLGALFRGPRPPRWMTLTEAFQRPVPYTPSPL